MKIKYSLAGSVLIATVAMSVVMGAINGGVIGAVRGFALGWFQGIMTMGFNLSTGEGGLLKMPDTARMAIVGAVGASVSYATGGWRGLATFGITFAATIAFVRISGAVRKKGGIGGGNESNQQKLKEILEQNITDEASEESYPLAFRDREEYEQFLQRVEAKRQSYGFQEPLTDAERQMFRNIARDFIIGTGLVGGAVVAPEAVTLCLGNPAGCTSFGVGFVEGFSKGSGIGTTGWVPSDKYDAFGSFIGERTGKFFDFQ